MKKPIIITISVLIFGLIVLLLIVQFSECSSIPWIHDLQVRWSHRKYEKKMDKRLSMLPAHVREKILEDDEISSTRPFKDTITNEIPDEVQRAVITFRILGLEDLMLAGGSGWTSSFSKILDGISIPAKIKAFTVVQNEPQALKAASWWLFKHISLVGYDDAYERIAEEHLKVALPVATSYAMTNWPKYEAHLAIKAISKIESYTAKTLLRQIVTGQLAVSDNTSIVFSKRPEMNCSPRALAALMLARSGDMQSLEQIRKLSEISKGDDQIVFNKALAILTESYKEKEDE